MTSEQETNRADVSAAGPREDETYCPECGQLRTGLAAQPGWRSDERAWWLWLLVAVGVFLAVTGGSRAWTANQTIVHFKAIQLMREPVDGAPQPGTNTTAVRQFDQSSLTAVLGLITVFVGLGALKCRKILGRASGPGIPEGKDAPFEQGLGKTVLLPAWTFVEGTYFSAMRILLIGGGYFAMSRLLQGDSPSVTLVDQTFGRVLDSVGAAMRMLQN